MLRFSTLRAARLALLFPFAVMATGCGDDSEEAAAVDASAGTDASPSDGGSSVNDTTAPTVLSVSPAPAATNVASNAPISVELSEAMAPATLMSPSTFSLVQSGSTVTIPGTVSYFDTTATFVPTSDLLLATSYTATLATAATDVAGNALSAAYTWSFTTDATAPAGPRPVLLGAATNYVMLAKTAITNVPTSVITGNIAVSPAAATYITGFGLTRAGTSWTSPQVVGHVFAADNDRPTPNNLTTAISDMQTAYTDAAGRPSPVLNLGAGTIGGRLFAPGLYKWTSSVTITTDITLSGAANDVWIFQITGDLKMSAAQKMTLLGGARPRNVFWQVAGAVDLGTSSHAEGNVLSQTAIALATGASVNGRLLSQTAVTIGKSTVSMP